MTSATTDRRLGLAGNTAYKTGATVLATANITQSGEQTIDTIAVKAVNAAGVPDRVLCTGMTDATKNGLWDVQTSAWTRSIDANGNYDFAQGTQVIIKKGSAAFQIWTLTSADPITIGTTALTWSQSLNAGSIATILATLIASAGSSLIGFIQAGAGAISRTLETKIRETVVSVKDFGAIGDGVTDDTAAINLALQATITFASVVRRAVYFPPGVYLVTGPLYLRAGCGMRGDGYTTARIQSSGFSGNNPVVRMGYGLISGTPTSDNSGYVPWVQGIYFQGTGCAIDTTGQSGFNIHRNWFNNVLGIALAGADGIVSENMFDTSNITGIQMTGSRNDVINNKFIGAPGSNFGIVLATPTFTVVSQSKISGNLFYAMGQNSILGFSTGSVDDLLIEGNLFSTNYTAGSRLTSQTHFLTQAGFIFKRISICGNTFEYALENDIAVLGGTGILEIEDNEFAYTGIVDGGASYALKHSILADQVPGTNYAIGDNVFRLVGGASVRLGGAGTKARISNCHNYGCGTGGTTLAASANEGDKSHIQIRNGAVDVRVSDCTTDSTALYVAGTFNASYFTGRHNSSARVDYDTHSATAGGTYFGERNNGGFAVAVVASAAALTLPFQGTETPVFSITGTTNVTSVVATGWEGRTVRLIFAGALTFTDGSNLKIAGNFVTTADDVIVLTCFGGNWYECGRSVN